METGNDMQEQIGKIILDLSKYPGEDFYCDGAVEDELLEIVRTYPEKEYARVIEERKSWAIMYHLSHLRENIVDWIPMSKDMKVLEVGSGCGAITGALARKAGSVTCVDLSKKRSTINATRHKDCDNVKIHVGNFKDIEPQLDTDFDIICLIGVFEYGQGYIGGETPYEDFLRILQKHIKKGGKIIIAIENKYGLKYFAGCREDHVGTYFEGIENYAQGGGVRTFSRNGLEKIFAACGVEEYQFYYPYPDYKFMTTVYSDEYQPGKRELTDNIRNFDRERMLLFDEKEAFDGIAEDHLFSVFSNSYLVVLGEELPVKYAKYSNDRAEKYQIRTEIRKDADKWSVRKYPLRSEAIAHVRSMEQAYQKLSDRYAGSQVSVSNLVLKEDVGEIWAEFEFCEGISLEKLMDTCLEQGRIEDFYGYLDEYVKRIGFGAEYKVSDMDAIFSNILVQGDKWVLIDYEWTFDEHIPIKDLLFRAVYCYLLKDEKHGLVDLDQIRERLQITEEQAEEYIKKEVQFQETVNGDILSVPKLYGVIGKEVVVPQRPGFRRRNDYGEYRVQVYTDYGEGYSEEESYFVPGAFLDEHMVSIELKVSDDVKMLRIDPGMNACICKVLEMNFNGAPISFIRRGHVIVNGRKVIVKDKETGIRQLSFLFPTNDPNINIGIHKLNPKKENILTMKLNVAAVPPQIAEEMTKAIGNKWFGIL